MSPSPKNEDVRRRLSRQAARDTKPEMSLRRELHRRGLRYRVQRRPVSTMRRTADIVFGPSKVVVDVRGCFWHRCPVHGNMPSNNRDWWRQKLDRNVERDAETVAGWEAAGWSVVVVWEHEDVLTAADRVESVVRSRR